MLFNQMKTIKGKVRFLLEQYPQLRDNDFKLVAMFYYLEIGSDKVESMTGYEVLKHLSNGKLSSPESIRRVRQKLQEDNENLRGSNYQRRKDDADTIRDKIIDL